MYIAGALACVYTNVAALDTFVAVEQYVSTRYSHHAMHTLYMYKLSSDHSIRSCPSTISDKALNHVRNNHQYLFTRSLQRPPSKLV